MSRPMSTFVFLCVVVVVGASMPTFPTEYEASIVMKMPYTGLVMPLKISTSHTSQKIDTFNGMQVENSSAVGTLKFVWNNSVRVCLWTPPAGGPKNMEGDAVAGAWKPAPIFPDLSQYTQVDDEEVTGFQKFVASASHGTTGTMNDEMAFFWDAVQEKPVRWQMNSRNPAFDSHTDIWIFEYLSLESGRPPMQAMELSPDCKPRTVPINSQLRSFFSLARNFGSMYAADVAGGFDAFAMQHGKSYSAEEHSVRQKIFEQNALLVATLNQQHAGRASFKGNAFLDMTPAEVLSFRGGMHPGNSREEWPEHEYDVLAAASLPKEHDWTERTPSVVTRVKDQGICGSCWTFGFLGAVETITAIHTGKLVELPEQFVVDCTWDYNGVQAGGNSGCDGGDPNFAAKEIIRKYNGLIPTAKSYGSYLSADGYCLSTQHMEAGARITSFVMIKNRDEMGLLNALVTKGPVSVGVIVPASMFYYDTGVFNVEACRHDAAKIDHSVVLVGFGSDAHGTDYYKIRNSWSTHWGDKGYIKIVRGELDCSIASTAGYPEIAPVDLNQTNILYA